ncbi:hypothetical protein A3A63_01325 [Candidatus Gottesmanbacteria bacterium RIFCSPLOWO2_01_FULL_46_9]|uniref:TNase-like domain-containing protein n=1 Tax=Candidatus Gottesmanbacteria bacterium RIFCSPLOWO2_01_FULL_46_9 TaxID=1798394 RepID=A0A1F6B318_9BACT|nr:MAG: hypothetical protein A3A63_01325 [Candidatus Gottesmanbacteria bacterium RIFCSPLOWO2_01_FULL_46_9]
MKHVGRYALLLILAASLGLNGYFFFSQQQQMTVVDVHDGDTFTLVDGQRVRLLGADAPELTRCGSEEAKQKLKSLVMGKNITLTEEKRDTYGRRMGLVYVGNTLVNETMLKAGFARPDYTKNSQNELLKAAYRYASDNSLGIHSSLCKKVSPKPPSPKCVIKGNIDKGTWAHLYHLPTCRHYNQIVMDEDMGEQFFCSEDEAKKAGFTLAPDCLR